MAEKGEITPKPECAIFADTKNEPASVYKWLDWLETKLSFPVIRVSKGDLGKAATRVRHSKHGTIYTKPSLPAFIEGGGIAPRQCTLDYKIIPIQQEIRRQIGKKGHCIQWLGISTNEADRMKPSRKKWIENRWPLIEKRMNRHDCMIWMKKNGYPEPPRSACYYCAFHSDNEWQRLKTMEPEAFQKAVQLEKDYQFALKDATNLRGKPFLHKSCKPLETIAFDQGHADFFTNECEGHCGL